MVIALVSPTTWLMLEADGSCGEKGRARFALEDVGPPLLQDLIAPLMATAVFFGCARCREGPKHPSCQLLFPGLGTFVSPWA